MRDTFKRLFQSVSGPQPQPGLLDRVFLAISLYKQRRAFQYRIILFSVLSVLAIIIFIPAYNQLASALSDTGFLHIASLMFTDAGAMLDNWQDAAQSLLETLPVFEMSLVLASVLFLLLSLKALFKNIQAVRVRVRGAF